MTPYNSATPFSGIQVWSYVDNAVALFVARPEAGSYPIEPVTTMAALTIKSANGPKH